VWASEGWASGSRCGRECGCGCAVHVCLSVCPCVGVWQVQVVKVRLQVQNVGFPGGGASGAGASGPSGAPYAGQPLASGPWDCAKLVLRTEGVRGLFRGWAPLVARDVPFNSVFFGCYNAYTKVLAPIGVAGPGGAGAGAGAGVESTLANDGGMTAPKPGPVKIWLAVGAAPSLYDSCVCCASFVSVVAAVVSRGASPNPTSPSRSRPPSSLSPTPCPCRVEWRVPPRGWCAFRSTLLSHVCRQALCLHLSSGPQPPPHWCPQPLHPPCGPCMARAALQPFTRAPARQCSGRSLPTEPCSWGEHLVPSSEG
jgi:hypothetical protein